MNLTLIRNATLILEYAGQRLLIDPYFAPKHSLRSFTGKSPNPLVDLPRPVGDIIAGIDGVLVSHLHADHFDAAAQDALPKDMPLLCQPGNDDAIREKGFTGVTVVENSLDWNGIHITRTGGHHGTGSVEKLMGTVSGFVLSASGEPTIYWAGDTVLCDEVRDAIHQHGPDVIVSHSSGATWPDDDGEHVLIVMDAGQTVEVCQLAPGAQVIATHMDSLDHGTVSRDDLRAAADKAGLDTSRLRIPADGETVVIGG